MLKAPINANKIRLLMSVVHFIMLYGCEIWADTLKTELYGKRMASVQRRFAVSTASSFWTVLVPAVLVIVGMIPNNLQAQEHNHVSDTRKNRIWMWNG